MKRFPAFADASGDMADACGHGVPDCLVQPEPALMMGGHWHGR
jgi:hypothetical protein